MFNEGVQEWSRGIARRVMGVFANTGLTPNMLTMFGLALNLAVAALLASGYLVAGALLLLFAAAFDMADGALAKVTGKASVFGAFLDSVIDRFSDAIMLGGLLLYYLLLPGNAHITEIMLIFAATVGGMMISYARAKAESLQLKGNVGFLARPERILLLAAGLLLSSLGWPLPAALWILAVGTQLTAIQRIWYVYRTVGRSS